MIDLIKDLIEGGFVGQAVIATLVTVAIVLMAYQGRPIPEFLIGSWGLIVGWFFRSQAQVLADRKTARLK